MLQISVFIIVCILISICEPPPPPAAAALAPRHESYASYRPHPPVPQCPAPSVSTHLYMVSYLPPVTRRTHPDTRLSLLSVRGGCEEERATVARRRGRGNRGGAGDGAGKRGTGGRARESVETGTADARRGCLGGGREGGWQEMAVDGRETGETVGGRGGR